MSVRKRGWLRIPLALGLGLLVFVLAGMISTPADWCKACCSPCARPGSTSA